MCPADTFSKNDVPSNSHNKRDPTAHCLTWATNRDRVLYADLQISDKIYGHELALVVDMSIVS